jgi:tRNA-Thr(GGU) m(6)t(6)A37 methyltransferase TsaA
MSIFLCNNFYLFSHARLWLNIIMAEILLKPIGHVRNSRTMLDDDNWGGVISEIILDASFPAESLDGLTEFSHAEILFHFDQAADDKILFSRHPRGNKDWPKVGVFAQRNKDRPNHIGLTVVEIVKREGRSLFVKNLDAVEGTPVLDIKPIMREFLPHGEIRQPRWSRELMKNYWNK